MSSKSNRASNRTTSQRKNQPQPQPQTVPEMQGAIETICKNHGIDIYREFAGLKLENPPFMPLVLENITLVVKQDGTSSGRLSVAHYYYQEGDACADPDIVFYFERDAEGVTRWTPFEITQAGLSQYFECYNWVARGATPEAFVINRQADIAELSRLWAENLRTQGFTAASNERPQLKLARKNEGEE